MSSLGDVMDERFTVRLARSERLVNETSCEMGILKTIAELSSQYYDGAYSGGVYQYVGYSDVTITILERTPQVVALQYRFAIWGLHRMLRAMIKLSGFHDSTAILYWNQNRQPGAQVEVARIHIFPTHPRGTGASNKPENFTALARRSDPLPQGSNLGNYIRIGETATNVSPFNVDPLQVFAELYGADLDRGDVFINICLAIVVIASHPNTGAMDVFGVKEGGSDSRFDWVIDEPRTSPPFFQWGYGARALELIPPFMLEKKRFCEVKFLVGYRDVPLGVGYLRKGDQPPVPLANVKNA